MTKPFEKTDRQSQAIREVLSSHRHGMLYGGSRSGKSAIIIRSIILRAIRKPSKHLIVRFRYNHARISLGHETIPWVFASAFPDLEYTENKSDGYYTLPTRDGGESQLWLGGTDDKERIEKVLGSEYSTIYANECSQIPFEAIATLWTRLAENSGHKLRFWYDCNPPGKKHWTNKLFHQGILPDKTPHTLDVASLQMNPGHNLENLPPEYIGALESLPRRQRQRFLEGKYLSDVEGALWTDEMIVRARLKIPAELRKTVIAVDPSVSNNPGSDECGIIPVSLDEDFRGVVHDDLSGKMSTREWAQKVVHAFFLYEANEVVAEKNQGGTLIEDAIHNISPSIPVRLISASTGKLVRAEPVSMLYEQGKVAHAKDLPDLEAELTETDFSDIKQSPNRLDALVLGLTHLVVAKGASRYHFG